jgi:malonate-semialdehyde dehydrogenase (acetylating)/methylmalonate-semialdehyde dehydrogenase
VSKVNTGMVGVNVPIHVLLAYHTFGGWKRSGFGDLNQQGAGRCPFLHQDQTVTARCYGLRHSLCSAVQDHAGYSISI